MILDVDFNEMPSENDDEILSSNKILTKPFHSSGTKTVKQFKVG